MAGGRGNVLPVPHSDAAESCALLTFETELSGKVHQLGKGTRVHLSHHLASVCLYRDLADAELKTDLFVQQAANDQGHDLPFPTAE